jgi:hypothetical protein
VASFVASWFPGSSMMPAMIKSAAIRTNIVANAVRLLTRILGSFANFLPMLPHVPNIFNPAVGEQPRATWRQKRIEQFANVCYNRMFRQWPEQSFVQYDIHA